MRAMNWAVPMLMLSGLGACSQEPDFDERFEAAQQHIEETAQSIDAELAADSANAQARATDSTEQVEPAGRPD